MSCRWCEIATASAAMLIEDPAFVIVGPGAVRGALGTYTLLPRAHVSVLSQLSGEDMAAVLAGLSRLSRYVKQESGATDVEIRAYPRHASSRVHLHFHTVPTLVPPCVEPRPPSDRHGHLAHSLSDESLRTAAEPTPATEGRRSSR